MAIKPETMNMVTRTKRDSAAIMLSRQKIIVMPNKDDEWDEGDLIFTQCRLYNGRHSPDASCSRLIRVPCARRRGFQKGLRVGGEPALLG